MHAQIANGRRLEQGDSLFDVRREARRPISRAVASAVAVLDSPGRVQVRSARKNVARLGTRWWNLARSHLRKRRDAWLLGAVGLVACVATVWAFAPGYMSMDSVVQFGQARSLDFWDQHPIVMALIWRYLDKLVPGPIGMLVLENVLYWFGLSAICGSLRWPLWLRALAIPLIGFYPPVFCIAGAIWKDTLMQGAFLAAVGCFIGFQAWRRRGLVVLGTVLTLLGVMVRYNGIGAAVPILALPLLGTGLARRVREPFRLPAVAAVSLVACTICLVLTIKATAPFAHRSNLVQLTTAFDLAGISLQSGELVFDEGSPSLSPGTNLKKLKQSYSLQDSINLFRCHRKGCKPALVRLDEPAEIAALNRNWARAVREHPAAYLRHRYAVFREASGLSGRAAVVAYRTPNNALAREFPVRPFSRSLLDWFTSMRGTVWFSAWIYHATGLVALVASLVFYARTRSALPLAFASSGLLLTLSVFVGSGGADNRYSVWPELCVILACVLLAQSWARRTPPSKSE